MNPSTFVAFRSLIKIKGITALMQEYMSSVRRKLILALK